MANESSTGKVPEAQQSSESKAEVAATVEGASLPDILGESDTEPESDENNERFYFRHKTINRFRVSEFEFRGNLLEIVGYENAARFVGYVNELPPIMRNSIVRVNRAAAAAAESSVSTVVKGHMGSNSIQTVRGAGAQAAGTK